MFASKRYSQQRSWIARQAPETQAASHRRAQLNAFRRGASAIRIQRLRYFRIGSSNTVVAFSLPSAAIARERIAHLHNRCPFAPPEIALEIALRPRVSPPSTRRMTSGPRQQVVALFLPKMDHMVQFIGLICEGPTDTAAGLDLGCHAIGPVSVPRVRGRLALGLAKSPPCGQ